MSKIELNNNYYFKMLVNENEKNVIDIKKIKFGTIKKKGNLLLNINFNTFNTEDYRKILKKLLRIKNKVDRKKIEIGITENSKKLIGYVVNYDSNNNYQKEFLQAVNAIFYNTRYERYDYIYDTVYDYLDNFFYERNLCDFKNNKCGEKRNTSSNIGCCRHYKNKLLGPLLQNNFISCEHLKEDYTCDAKCLSCKLFTCDYLRKKGVRFKIKDILLLDVFFNPLQKYYIKTKVFTPKEEILKKLMIL